MSGLVGRVATGLRDLFGERYTSYAMLRDIAQGSEVEDVAGMYELLRDLYFNDRVESEDQQAIPGYRNPTQAVVEFYVSTVWPGNLPEALPIEPGDDVPDGDALIAAIHQVWSWSNWSVAKQEHVRTTAMLGDGLIKVATSADERGRAANRVYLQSVDPQCMTDFDLDERGYFTFLRLDAREWVRDPVTGEREEITQTEVWSKELGTMRLWRHRQGTDRVNLRDLGEPDEELAIRAMVGDDFIPFVHVKHRSVGTQRGVAAITLALVKAYQANRMATRLHDLLYRFGRPDLILQSDLVDDDGNPMLPPMIDDDGEQVEIGGVYVWRLPGGWKLGSMILDLPFEIHRAVLSDHLIHTKQTDLPELGFYEIAESDGERSGKALQIMLTAAIARGAEVRGNHESALIRAHQMALTIGKHHRLPKFTELGDYHAGQFDHRFTTRSILPISEEEEATIDKLRAEAQAKKREYGYSKRLLMEQDGLTTEEIDASLAETDAGEAASDLLDDPEEAEAQQLFEAAMSRDGGDA